MKVEVEAIADRNGIFHKKLSCSIECEISTVQELLSVLEERYGKTYLDKGTESSRNRFIVLRNGALVGGRIDIKPDYSNECVCDGDRIRILHYPFLGG